MAPVTATGPLEDSATVVVDRHFLAAHRNHLLGDDVAPEPGAADGAAHLIIVSIIVSITVSITV